MLNQTEYSRSLAILVFDQNMFFYNFKRMDIYSEDDLVAFSSLASSNFPPETDSERFFAAPRTDDNCPVTRRELIDAIAKLHVINDNSDSFSTILNKL